MKETSTMESAEKIISEVKRKHSLRSIVFEYEYDRIVTCKAFKYHGKNFCFVGSDALSAVNGVTKLIEKYDDFKSNVIDAQLEPDGPYGDVNGKNYSKKYAYFKEGYLVDGSDGATLHWEYEGGHLFVKGISFKRGLFFLSDPPRPIGDMGHTTYRLSDSSLLKEGEELWFWDDMQCLSGRAGQAIVKDGMAIATLVTMMS